MKLNIKLVDLFKVIPYGIYISPLGRIDKQISEDRSEDGTGNVWWKTPTSHNKDIFDYLREKLTYW